jgi:Ca2+-binding RTX toxin-like protein
VRVWTAAVVLGVLATLVFAVTPVASGQEVPTCQGEPATIVATGTGPTSGTDGSDVIVGTTGADTIYGLGGDDLICGAPDGSTADGADWIGGGAGKRQHCRDAGQRHDLRREW